MKRTLNIETLIRKTWIGKLSKSRKNNLSLKEIMVRGRVIQSIIHFLSPIAELTHKNIILKCHLFYKTDVYRKASL